MENENEENQKGIAYFIGNDAAERREAILALIASGYAGMTPTGIVDRREVPDALPIQASEVLRVPPPLPLEAPNSRAHFHGRGSAQFVNVESRLPFGRLAKFARARLERKGEGKGEREAEKGA